MRTVLLTIDVHSDSKISGWCQKQLFLLGYSWIGRGDVCQYLHKRYLYVYAESAYIAYGETLCNEVRQAEEYEHIDAYDYFNNNVIKELQECD